MPRSARRLLTTDFILSIAFSGLMKRFSGPVRAITTLFLEVTPRDSVNISIPLLSSGQKLRSRASRAKRSCLYSSSGEPEAIESREPECPNTLNKYPNSFLILLSITSCNILVLCSYSFLRLLVSLGVSSYASTAFLCFL